MIRGIGTNPEPMDLFWYCRYPNGTTRVSSADINSWIPLSKSRCRFSRNSVCSTNFMRIRQTVYWLVLGQKLRYVRTDLVFIYDIPFCFLKTWFVETCSLLLLDIKWAVPTVAVMHFIFLKAPNTVQQERCSANSWVVMFVGYSVTHAIRHAYSIMKTGVWWAMDMERGTCDKGQLSNKSEITMGAGTHGYRIFVMRYGVMWGCERVNALLIRACEADDWVLVSDVCCWRIGVEVTRNCFDWICLIYIDSFLCHWDGYFVSGVPGNLVGLDFQIKSHVLVRIQRTPPLNLMKPNIWLSCLC